MYKRINSVILKDCQEIEEVYNLLIDIFNVSKIKLVDFPDEFDLYSYYYVKSHRSNVTKSSLYHWRIYN